MGIVGDKKVNNMLNSKIEELHRKEKLLTKERLIEDVKKTERKESNIITFLIFLILIGLCIYGLLASESYKAIFIFGALIAFAFIYPVINNKKNLKRIVNDIKNDDFIIRKDAVSFISKKNTDELICKEVILKFNNTQSSFTLNKDKDILPREGEEVYLICEPRYNLVVKLYVARNVIIDDSLKCFLEEE